jgi:hypothetical protein
VWIDSAKPCGLKEESNTLFVYGKYSINWHHLAANVIFHPLISQVLVMTLESVGKRLDGFLRCG